MGYNKPEESDVRVYSVRPLPPASRPRWAALLFCASAEPTKSVAIAFALWYDKFNKLEFERSVKYEIPIL